MKIATALEYTYQATLGPDFGLQEAMSNGTDAQAQGKGAFSVTYLPNATRDGKKGCVVFYTAGVKLPTNVIAMGVSGSRAYQELIGEFGEGFPLFLLIMARNHDTLTAVVYNDDEMWTPYLDIHEGLSSPGEPCWTLHVKTRKLKERRNGVEIKVWGITQEEYDTLLKKFLDTHPDYDSTKTVSVGHTGESIITDPKFKGLIYNKGVLVMARPGKLSYGYNLRRRTNRDREMMDQWDLEYALATLTIKAFEQDPERFGEHIVKLLEDTNSMEAANTYAYTTSSKVVQNVADLFVAEHGENAVPVSSIGEVNKLSHVGKQGIIVGSRRLEVLTKDNRIKGVDDALDDGETSIKRIVQPHELTPDEVANLVEAATYLNSTDAVEAGDDVLNSIQVVLFGGDNIAGTFKRDGGKAFICLAHKTLGNLKDTIETLFHEVAHLEGGDGDVRHERRQVDLLTQALLRAGGK